LPSSTSSFTEYLKRQSFTPRRSNEADVASQWSAPSR
jgi:hypothetical protein